MTESEVNKKLKEIGIEKRSGSMSDFLKALEYFHGDEVNIPYTDITEKLIIYIGL